MGSGIYDSYFHHDPAEVSKCMLCYDPECSKACPQSADIGGIIRSLYFQDYMAAVRKLSCDCTYCSAPCEKAYLLSKENRPVAIKDLAA